jgi:hypothetical protein
MFDTCIWPPQIEFSITTAYKLYTMYLYKLHKQYSVVKGGFRGGRAPPPLKFAKHMLYNIN